MVTDVNLLNVRSLVYDIPGKILVEYTNCVEICRVLGGFKIVGSELEKAGQYGLWGSCYSILRYTRKRNCRGPRRRTTKARCINFGPWGLNCSKL